MKNSSIALLLIPNLVLAEPKVPTKDITDIIDRVPEVTLNTKNAQDKEAEAKADAEPEEKKEEAPEKVTIHIIEKGGTLGQISEKAYGRTRYWRILKLYNKCDPGKLKIGQTIKAPDLPWLFDSCGLKEKFPTVVDGFLKIQADLIAIEDAQPDKKYSKEALSKIDKLGTLVGELSATLQTKTKGVKTPPYATLKQLRTCRTHLNRIAAQKKSGGLNLNALAHEHLSNAMVYGILWAEAGFK